LIFKPQRSTKVFLPQKAQKAQKSAEALFVLLCFLWQEDILRQGSERASERIHATQLYISVSQGFLQLQ
jgi:hypothetical protein